MVGRLSSALGLMFAAIFMLVIGYFLTLDVYRYEGSYVVFYAGRYYGGIACMIVGGILFFAGILLPIFWPSAKEKQPILKREKQASKSDATQSVSVSSPSKSATQRSIELKIKGISMQSTCGAEAIQVLRVLSQQSGTKRCSLSKIVAEANIDENKVKKTINLLLNLGLIERSDSAGKEGYRIPQDIEEMVLEGINKIH
jgi:predicted transcriptional regulator